MYSEYNVTLLIDILGFAQGVILGLMLLFINREKKKTTTFLGLFILSYSLAMLPEIVEISGSAEKYPQLGFLPFDFGWLMFPLFHIYVQKISVFSDKKPQYALLYPGLLHFLLQVIVCFLPLNLKIEIDESLWYNIIGLVSVPFSVWVGILTIRWINRHIKEIGNQFSTIEHKELRWAKRFVILGLLFIISAFFVLSYFESSTPDIVYSIVNVVLLYWISLRGILQINVTPVVTETVSNIKESNAKDITGEKEGNLERLVSKLEAYMNESQIYANTDLTINDVAGDLGIHPKLLSKAINTVKGQNFNALINQYRIQRVKALLRSDDLQHLSVEGIGNEVGFLSKSSFYAAFKKVAGTTPSKYRDGNS